MRKKNLSFLLDQILILSSVFVLIICYLDAMKIKDSLEQITLDLFKNFAYGSKYNF